MVSECVPVSIHGPGGRRSHRTVSHVLSNLLLSPGESICSPWISFVFSFLKSFTHLSEGQSYRLGEGKRSRDRERREKDSLVYSPNAPMVGAELI